ncbi:MAG: YCF48-related protein [Bacteroidia bacterium]
MLLCTFYQQLSAQWNLQPSGTTETLLGVSFPAPDTGWVVGSNGKILNTINGGNNWNIQPSGTTSFLRDVYFTNTSHGVIVGESGLIKLTNNGGANFSNPTSGQQNI